MKRNAKFYRQKQLRKNLEEYLAENRAKEHYSDKWVPGSPKNETVRKMIRAKIGCGNMMSKGERKWEKTNRKLEHKRNRKFDIDTE